MASHPPPKSPKKLMDVIEAGMLNIDRIPRDMDTDFDPRAWELSYDIPVDMPDILKTMENNVKNLDWQLHQAAVEAGGSGWYLWKRTEGQDTHYLIWLSDKPTKWNDMSLMTMNQGVGGTPLQLDYFVVTRIHQNDTWGHQNDFLYTLILPTDENKMWSPISKIDNVAINFKIFPKVLLEGA